MTIMLDGSYINLTDSILQDVTNPAEYDTPPTSMAPVQEDNHAAGTTPASSAASSENQGEEARAAKAKEDESLSEEATQLEDDLPLIAYEAKEDGSIKTKQDAVVSSSTGMEESGMEAEPATVGTCIKTAEVAMPGSEANQAHDESAFDLKEGGMVPDKLEEDKKEVIEVEKQEATKTTGKETPMTSVPDESLELNSDAATQKEVTEPEKETRINQKSSCSRCPLESKAELGLAIVGAVGAICWIIVNNLD